MSSLIHSSHPILVFVFVLLMLMSFASWYVIIYKGLKLFGEYKAFNKFKAENLNIKDWPIKRNFKNSYGSVKLLIDESKDLERILEKYQDRKSKNEILEMHNFVT